MVLILGWIIKAWLGIVAVTFLISLKPIHYPIFKTIIYCQDKYKSFRKKSLNKKLRKFQSILKEKAKHRKIHG